MPVSKKILTKLFSATIEYIIPNKNDPSTFINNVENCGKEDTFIITINPKPSPTISGTNSTCVNTTSTLSLLLSFSETASAKFMPLAFA